MHLCIVHPIRQWILRNAWSHCHQQREERWGLSRKNGITTELWRRTQTNAPKHHIRTKTASDRRKERREGRWEGRQSEVMGRNIFKPCKWAAERTESGKETERNDKKEKQRGRLNKSGNREREMNRSKHKRRKVTVTGRCVERRAKQWQSC